MANRRAQTFTPKADKTGDKFSGSLAAKSAVPGGADLEVTLKTSGVMSASLEAANMMKGLSLTLDCETPAPGKPKRAAPTRTEKNRRNRLKKREKKRAARQAAADAELPPCREIATPPAVLAALAASDRAATPEPTAEPPPSKPGGASSWGRGFLAIGTIEKTAPQPDLRDPYAYIASTIDDDLTAPALHDAPSPNFDGLVIEEVTREELEALNV